MIGMYPGRDRRSAVPRAVSLSSCLFLLLVLRGEARADAATLYTSTDGRAVMPMAETQVAMVAETVLVTPAGKTGRFLDPMGVRVECVFHFLNTGSGTVTSEVGFPFEAVINGYSVIRDYWGDEDDFSGLDSFRELVESGRDPESIVPDELGFSAAADGEPLLIEYRFGDCDRSARHEFYPLWAVWEMSFPPGEDVLLECSYNTAYNISAYDSFHLDLTYITRTGALWTGPIGSAVVTFVLPDSIPLPGLGFDMACWWDWTGSPEVTGRTITWRYTDWEPDTDLTFEAHGMTEIGTRGMLDIEGNPASLLHWGHPDSLLESATRMLNDMCLSVDSRTISWILRQICEEQNGLSGGHWLIEFTPDSTRHPEWATALDGLDSILSAEEALVESAGYAPLLPMFSLRSDWSGLNHAKYGAYPSLEARYLSALSHLESAVAGETVNDPVIRSFFRLANWLPEWERSDLHDGFFDSSGFPGAAARDSVIAWWSGEAAVPLVMAEAVDGPVSELPFAFRVPSPPFPDTPQVNSVLNDGDLLTGWRSGLEGGGHGEILEVFVFPLPGLEPSFLHGFSIVNGFGWEPGLPRGHIVRALVSVDGSPVCTADLAGGPVWQSVELPEPLEGARTLSLEIIESVPDGAGSAAGISELRLY